MKYRRIFITSSKGGVGKSTVAANLSFAFAALGYRTLVIDFDLSNRSLDMLFGCENRVLYDIGDLIDGVAEAQDVVLRHSPRLYFVPGYAVCRKAPAKASVEKALEKLEAYTRADVVLFDTSGSADSSAKIISKLADAAIVVSTESAVSIRAAESSAALLAEAGVRNQWLVINRFRTSLFGRDRAAVSEIIDRTRLPIIGLVPHSEYLASEQEEGRLIAEAEYRDNCRLAFRNIARRLTGREVPLFDGFSRMSDLRRRLLLR